MISSILFDFGGTLDADGAHWLDRFYRIYEQIGLGFIPKNRIKEAFYGSDDQLYKEPAVRKQGYRAMVATHVRGQFIRLGLNDAPREARVVDLFVLPAETILHRNRAILQMLKAAGFRLGIVSNNYGNLPVICQEMELLPFLDVVLDSALIGLAKPDPAIFQRALEMLGQPAAQVAFVGDNWTRDILPAKSAGMKTFWLTDSRRDACPDRSQADGILKSLEELPEQVQAAAGISR